MFMEKNEPLVSIIMNCYNCESYLNESIESVLNQTYKNFEIIFWDNNSTDNSSVIYNEYKNNDNRLKYFYSKTHTMLGEARNLAIEKASGEWIAFLDCDDIWLPEKLEKQINLYYEINNSDVNLIYGQSLIFNDSTLLSNSKGVQKLNKYRNKFLLKKLPEGKIFNKLLFINFIPLVTAIVKKSSIEKVGKINVKYNILEDYELFLKITLIGDALAIHHAISLYRIHATNTTILKKNQKFVELFETIEFYKDATIFQEALKFHKAVQSISLFREKKVIKALILFTKESSLNSIFKLLKLKYMKKI